MQLAELRLRTDSDLVDLRRKMHETAVALTADSVLAARFAGELSEMGRRLVEARSPAEVRFTLEREGSSRMLSVDCVAMDPPPALREGSRRDAQGFHMVVRHPVSSDWVPQETLDHVRTVLTRKSREELLAESNDLLRQTMEERMAALDRLDREFSSIQDLDTVLARLLAGARDTFRCERGSILLHEDRELRFAHTAAESTGEFERLLAKAGTRTRLPIDRASLAGTAAIEGVVRVADAYTIPEDAPYRFNRSVDLATGFRTRAVLSVAMRNNRNELLGVMQLLNPHAPGSATATEFSSDDERLAVHFAGMAAGAIDRSSMTRALVLRMMRLAELRDPKETGAHVRRVSDVASHLFIAWARQRNMPEAEVLDHLDKLRPAAMLHDVGKVGISDAILKKPDKLTDAEYGEMKLHTTIGAETLLGVHTSLDDAVREVTLYHHARWDGKGYPSHADITATMAKLGLDVSNVPEPAGLGIPLPARLVAVADVFDALMSRRAYKEPWDPSKVREEIARCGGTHFDPELAELFVSNFDDYCSVHAGNRD